MNGVIRVFLVSGNEAMREELRQMVSSEEGIIVVGEGALVDAKEPSPDVILMLADERMPGMNVIDTTRAISETQLPAKVIIIAANTDQYLVSAIKAGAAGILPRNISRDELLSAIRKIHLWSPSSSSSR